MIDRRHSLEKSINIGPKYEFIRIIICKLFHRLLTLEANYRFLTADFEILKAAIIADLLFANSPQLILFTKIEGMSSVWFYVPNEIESLMAQ